MSTSGNIVSISLGHIQNSCFVIMPFDPLFRIQYERVLRPAIEAKGLNCIRGDEIYARPDIISDVWKAIRESRLVVADLTGRNANVFYELGLAHALGKPMVLLTRSEADVPFDLKSLRYWFYDVNDPFWGQTLGRTVEDAIERIMSEPDLTYRLEGVDSDVVLPARPQSPRLSTSKATLLVAGVWRGRWRRTGALLEHQGTASIFQEGNELSATLNLTFVKDAAVTVIEERLVGSVLPTERKIQLTGVSYTYLAQGHSSSYMLDNFVLVVDEPGNEMSGEFRSSKGPGAAIFTRVQSVQDSERMR